jgi:hypothetical protein
MNEFRTEMLCEDSSIVIVDKEQSKTGLTPLKKRLQMNPFGIRLFSCYRMYPIQYELFRGVAISETK